MTTPISTGAIQMGDGLAHNGLLTSATFASNLGTNNWTLQNQYTYTVAGQPATKTLSVANAAGLLTTTYGYDPLGGLISIQYPSPSPLTLTYTLDSLERPVGLTDNTGYNWASNVQYNPANQITNAIFPSGTQTWIYNTLQQLTQRTTTTGSATMMNVTYNYTAGQNNGQIANSIDAVTGETIVYAYDSLKRLTNAASTSTASGSALWSDAYTYDGFGNMTGMAGNGAPSLSVSVTPATNRISPTNILYDGNGNVTQFGPSGSLTTLVYDVANRVQTVNSTNAYAYDPANQRTYFRTSAGAETLYLYGLGGEKLATYTIAGIAGSQVNFTFQSRNVYFAGSLISAEGNAVAVDRLGSVRWSASTAGHTYFPYGVEYSATANNTEKYVTYTRDTLSGLDYAMNRYYNSGWGRFMSPDPSCASMDLRTRLSWNRYMYTLGDPVGGMDPSGLDTYCGPSLDWDGEGCTDGTDGGDDTPLPTYNQSAIGIPAVTTNETYGGEAPSDDPTIYGSNGGFGLAILGQVSDNAGPPVNGLFYTTIGLVSLATGADALASGGAALTMLGSGNYATIAGVTGAEALDIPADVWNALPEAGQIQVIQDWIQTAISSGSQIISTSDPADAPAGTWLAYEYEYITEQFGGQFVANGTSWTVVLPPAPVAPFVPFGMRRSGQPKPVVKVRW
jgi:RHS repeat-associated protein